MSPTHDQARNVLLRMPRWTFLGAFLLCLFGVSRVASSQTYRHDITGSLNIEKSSGATEASQSPSEASKAKSSAMGMTTTYGYIFSSGSEPVFELGYLKRDKEVGLIKHSETDLEIGLGMIFNMPLGNKSRNKRTKDAAPVPDSNEEVRWIPYSGIMLSKTATAESITSATAMDFKNDEMINKLILGIKMVILPNVAINSSVRFFYQRVKATSSEGEQTSETGANGLTIQARLLAISLLL